MVDRQTAASVVIAPDRHVFLSPHYDDIALSAGGAAALAARAGKQTEIALIFGSEPDRSEPLSEFAEAMHRGWGMSSADVIAGRRAEEAVASKALGATDVFLPFHDAIYRGHTYLNNDQLFARPAANDADLPAAIAAWLDANGGDGSFRFYAPLASGFHVDHQLAFEAARILRQAGHEVWFYEDLPYSLNPTRLQARLDDLDGQVEVAALVDVSSVWDAKIEAIMSYPSQLPTIFDYVGVGHSREEIDAAMGGYARAYGDGVPMERYWRFR
ncbi:MAG: PIG-L family deacetylase [Thermomicrobiales bacterium]|nr:PIG-L family deacetylase [Thermomicrobiales bacterium]